TGSKGSRGSTVRTPGPGESLGPHEPSDPLESFEPLEPSSAFVSMIWIAVDAMGGDFAPALVVDGALAAARHFDLGVALVGAPGAVEAELGRHHDVDRNRVRIVDAAD